MAFIANFIRFPAVQKFWKSIKIWQSWRQFNGGTFFETQCRQSWAYLQCSRVLFRGYAPGVLCGANKTPNRLLNNPKYCRMDYGRPAGNNVCPKPGRVNVSDSEVTPCHVPSGAWHCIECERSYRYVIIHNYRWRAESVTQRLCDVMLCYVTCLYIYSYILGSVKLLTLRLVLCGCAVGPAAERDGALWLAVVRDAHSQLLHCWLSL